eukprot:2604705-Amphidinium_carterae.1
MTSFGYERQPQLFGARPLQYRQGTSVATTKQPPTWSPEMAIDPIYPYVLTEWVRDVERWMGATEVAEETLSVGSAARTIADQPARTIADQLPLSQWRSCRSW